VTHPRPGKESATELAAEPRYPDLQSYLLTTDRTQGHKMSLVKTGQKHPTKVTADKAHQKNHSFLRRRFMLARLEVCQVPRGPPSRSQQDRVPKLPALQSTLGKSINCTETLSLWVLLFLSTLSCHCACHLVILGYLSSQSA